MNLSSAALLKLSLHFVGNKSSDGRFLTSPELIALPDDLKDRLIIYYLNKFHTVAEKYRFFHPISLEFNEVYKMVSEIFKSQDKFGELGTAIARHLFEKSEHPNIKPGELHVCYFSNCAYNDRITDAIGLFKTEDKSGYFEVAASFESLGLEYREGIDINKFEKGCLIFNDAEETGYELYVINKQNRSEDAKYWMDEFLGLMQINNEFAKTNEVLSIAKNYITTNFAEEFQVTKTDKIDLLNRSIDYFKNHESFDKSEFEQEVFYHPEMIESFRHFDEQYRQHNEIDIEDNFSISKQAVKKQARVFKSVLKLDRNFHIYIHGSKELIEKGVDENGRKYYKIYYETES